ncbi:hypothetical protein FRB99_007505 [Tulasnella sp. 403]|nr:hypothetical protein FRB99_007505 [Tulasnella sp. 403]
MANPIRYVPTCPSLMEGVRGTRLAQQDEPVIDVIPPLFHLVTVHQQFPNWTSYTNPRGRRYFVGVHRIHTPDHPTPLHETAFENMSQRLQIYDENYDIFIHINPNLAGVTTIFWYVVHHGAREIIWDPSVNEYHRFGPGFSPKARRVQYWQHVENFPHRPIDFGLVQEIKEIHQYRAIAFHGGIDNDLIWLLAWNSHEELDDNRIAIVARLWRNQEQRCLMEARRGFDRLDRGVLELPPAELRQYPSFKSLLVPAFLWLIPYFVVLAGRPLSRFRDKILQHRIETAMILAGVVVLMNYFFPLLDAYVGTFAAAANLLQRARNRVLWFLCLKITIASILALLVAWVMRTPISVA